MHIRQAWTDDAQGIRRVRERVWPHDPVEETRIDAALCASDHSTSVAISEDAVIGFVDGFVTVSAAGIRRWEVDLLAVHPASRGQGIASQLVEHSTRAGLEHGAALARALIQVDNTASQRAFEKNAYITNSITHHLYVTSARYMGGALPVLPGMHAVVVSTLNYRGVWLEGCWTADAFRAAQALLAQHQCDVAGAVIPAHDADAGRAAQVAGYELIALYHWWYRDLHR